MRPLSASRAGYRHTAAERAALVAEFHRSQLTATEFCARVGVSRASLSRWQTAARRLPPAPPVVFQELSLAPARVPLAPATTRPAGPAPWWVLEVVTPDGTVVRGCEATSLARLLTALGAAGC